MKKWIGVLLAALFVAAGCESDNPTKDNQTEAPDYLIRFDQSGYDLNAIIGDTAEIEYRLQVIDRNKDNGSQSPAPGVPVLVETFNEHFLLSSEGFVSDSAGYVQSTARIAVDSRTTRLMIRATVDRMTGATYATITGYKGPMRMILSAPTHTLIVPRGVDAKLNINGLVLDSAAVGVRKLAVTCRIENPGGAPFGGVSFSDETDIDGNFRVFYHSTGGFGIEHLIITSEVPGVPGTTLSERFIIETIALEDQIGSLEFYALPEQVILPENGESEVIVQALVLDRSDTPLPGVTVNFNSSAGVIQSSVMTDSVGFARALWHTGTEPDTAELSAHVYGTTHTVNGSVAVISQPESNDPLAAVTLFSDELLLIAGSQQSTDLHALVQKESGGIAEQGTVVYFEILEGDGRLVFDRAVTDRTGEATVTFFVGMTMGVTRIWAYVPMEEPGMIESNEVRLRTVAGAADHVEFRLDDGEIPLGGSTSIHALAIDAYRNPVEGEVVTFSTTLGEITPAIVTDETGRGTAVLNAGRLSGIATITVNWNGRITTYTVRIVGDMPNSITLTADPLIINPVIGNRTSTLRAYVRDENGTMFGRPVRVVFEMVNQSPPPEGCTFPNDSLIDSSMASEGYTEIDITSGTQIGGVVVRAYTWRDEARLDTVSTTISTIQVVGGPPSALELDVDPRGADAGGGIWNLNVSIRAYDANTNPSGGEYPVNLILMPDDVATITPTRLEDGSARATLSYPSSSTYQPVSITASIETETGPLTARQDMILPLQRGFLTLTSDPQTWMFDRGRPDDTCLVRVWATLRDGHDELINNAPIVFSTDRARFYWRNMVGGRYAQFFPEPARKLTGLVNQNHNEPPGVATVFLRGKMDDFYLDNFTLEVTVHLEARVDGTDVVSDPETVFMTRH